MSIIADTIRIAEGYASIRGDSAPTGQDYMSAAVAAGERPDMVRATAEIAACERLNREANAPRLPTHPETLAERAAAGGKRGKKARRLMASGRYTGAETLSLTSGRWEIAP